MAILEFTLEGTYANQKFINRWNYVATGTPAAVTYSFALASALGFVSIAVDPLTATDWFSVLRRTQHESTLYTLASVRNVYSDTDFYSTPLTPAAGLLTGVPTAPFIAVGYKTNQVTKKVRPGQKRMVGINDASMVGGGGLTGTFKALAESFADVMSTALAYNDEGQPIALQPAICGKKPPEVEPVTKSYTYYPTEAEQMANTATSIIWSVKNTVRSQVSRQYGRGV